MLSQKIFDVPGGFHLSLPIADYYSAKNGRIEGIGVKPDIETDASDALNVALRQRVRRDLRDCNELARVESVVRSKAIRTCNRHCRYYWENSIADVCKWSILPVHSLVQRVA